MLIYYHDLLLIIIIIIRGRQSIKGPRQTIPTYRKKEEKLKTVKDKKTERDLAA